MTWYETNSLLLRTSCGGVSNAFSKSRMNVSTCPPLSKILAQSFVTIVNWVSQLCLFLNACFLSERSLYSFRWAMMFEQTMCSSNLQGTQVSEIRLFAEGPKALKGFKPLKSLVTTPFETTMSSMKGADLLRNGTALWSLVEHTRKLTMGWGGLGWAGRAGGLAGR